jgi:hypothetical protein
MLRHFHNTDIDIDVANRDDILALIPHVSASMTGDKRHPSGIYIQDMPRNPITNNAILPYGDAGNYGFIKLDILNNSIYTGVKSPQHLDELISSPVVWEILDDPDLVKQLAHIGNHFDVVESVTPRSIEDLALILGLIRPGKRYLVSRPRSEQNRDIWVKNTEGYTFKKSHAISYAMAITVQMALMVENANA